MIAIKGMEMPKTCYECSLRNIRYYINCSLIFSECSCDRHPDCPLVDIVTCKDCKYWKDSDGVYRRGIGAESKCPINIKEVLEGNFYCKMGERKE